MHNVLAIIRREFMTRVRTRAFFIGTVIVLYPAAERPPRGGVCRRKRLPCSLCARMGSAEISNDAVPRPARPGSRRAVTRS